ncbi:MAG: tetratricopeptide repeat protein [Bdellovibrionales bacterium]|nr:tetratricopeptide repeat protein [Bdellovibrionales bacterium]
MNRDHWNPKIHFVFRIGIPTFGVMFALICSEVATAKGKEKSPNETGGLTDLKFVEGDDRGNEVRAIKTEMLVTASEERAVKQIQALLKKYRGTPLEPDLMFRLAEMYMRRAKSETFFELNRLSDTVVTLAPEEITKVSSRKAIQSAIDIYETIQSKFRDYGQMDVVFFNNAFARQQLGQNREAEQRYWLLIKTFGDSSLVPDCHLAIGELSFDRQDFKNALDHFNAIKKYPDSRVYPYGLYKAGWTYYNMRNALAGLKELEKTVEYGRFVVKNNIDARLDLRREALSDMTIFFEEVYPASKAWTYFSEQAQGLEVGPYLIKMANLYKRHSRFGDIVAVLRDFSKNQPESDLRPDVDNELAIAYDNLKDYPSAVAQLESLFKICEPKGRWEMVQLGKLSANAPAKKSNGTKTSVADAGPQPHDLCNEKLEDTSLRLATRWHKLWRTKKENGNLAESAEKAFEIYLRRAIVSEETLDVRFSYAELLFQRNKFREASDSYSIVGKGSTRVEKSHEGLYAASLALEKAVGEKWSDQDEKQFGSLVREYVNRHKDGKFRLDLEFKVGLIAYDKGRYGDAAPVFHRLGNEFAKDEKGRKSQDLYLDILNIKKDYASLKNYAAQLRQSEKGTGDRKDKLTKIYEQAYFMEVQTIEEKGDLNQALVGYKGFISANPSSPLTEKAWWNSIQVHFKLSDLLGGADACEQFYQKYPNSKKSVEALLRAAQTYEEIVQLERASRVLLLLSKADVSSSAKWKSLAADYQSISGRRDQAISLYEELRSSKDAAISFHSLEQLEILSRDKAVGPSRKALLKAVAHSGREPQASLARLEILEEIYSSGDLSEAFNEAKKIVSLGKSASKRALARARFIQAQILEKEFYNQSVKGKAERITVVLALKTEKLEKAQQAYQDSIKYGNPDTTVSSLEKLSDLYRHFVNSLRGMELPEGLESRDEPVFREEMEKLAIPLEEKSVEALAQSLELSRKLKIRDGSVARLQQKLNQANMISDEMPRVDILAPAPVLPAFSQEVGT